MKKTYLRQIIQEEIKEVMDAFGSLGAVDWGDPVASRQRRGEVKVGDILTMVDKNSPVYGQKGKVIRIYDSKEGVEVDFGSGNKYGIINRRIKGNKINESVNEAKKFKNKEEVVDALVKDFGKNRKSYYNTPTNSNNEKYWTYNRTVKFYYDLVKKEGYGKSFDNMFKGTTPSDIDF
tara:strand:- start:91 stop:621 length:531 start_codon:yes stop_codon:yes gene_type:complete